VLLNDTVATLLAGKSASAGLKYDSFIGFILGTGTNTCYIEKNNNILKKWEPDKEGSQIINIESGDFGKPPQTDLDIEFCSTTTDPGSYKFEKMFSGAYFGGLTLYVLKAAAKEGVFSVTTAEAIGKLTDLQTWDANSYVARQISQGHPIVNVIRECNDADSCRHIIEVLIDRAAKLVAGSMSAVILKCGKGRTPDKPVLITVEGTTFYKLHNFKPQFESCLNGYLTGELKRYFEFAEVTQSGLVGAALAALTE
jgi:hexokinase